MTAATRIATWWGERRAWRSADTLQDLAHLTTRWLTGDLHRQPGYGGPVDVDDAPGLLDALIALNRAGMLTCASQAGWVGDRMRGLAAVEGFAHPDTVGALARALDGTPYQVAAHPRPRGLRAPRRSVPVAWVGGDAAGEFGGFGPARDIRHLLKGAGHYAVQDVIDALQVVIYDPAPGRNTLWPDLLAVLGATPRTADDTEVTA